MLHNDSRVWRLLVVPAALALTVTIGAAQDEDRAGELRAKLEAGRPVRIVALGDSLTDGMGVRRPNLNAFPQIFTAALGERYQSPIELLTAGVPGDTSQGGLWRLADDVLNRRPDLVTVQFGGNDQSSGRTPEQYAETLEQIVTTIRDQTRAAIILCTPPMGDTAEEARFVTAAKQLGRRLGLPVADLDGAIRRGPHDYRGPFPYGSHPADFTHVIMAQELYRAFDELLGASPRFRVELVRGGRVIAAGSELRVRVKVVSQSEQTETGQVTVASGLFRETKHFEVSAGSTEGLEFALRAPAAREVGRAQEHRVWVVAVGKDYCAFDLGWVVFAPVVSLDAEGVSLDSRCLVLGSSNWRGSADLSAKFRVRSLEGGLAFEIAVTDDDLSVGRLSDPAQGDCVELYLDLRPPVAQGRPVYSPEVLALQVIPAEDRDRHPRWRTLDAPPDGLKEVQVSSRRAISGYTIEVFLPRSFVARYRDGDWSGIGLDVGVNDADGGGWRKSQLMWSGCAQNYLMAGWFGGLRAQPEPREALRLVVQ